MYEMILFGTGSEGMNALKFLPSGTVRFFTDNNSSVWGTKICGISVISPEEAFEKKIPIYVTPVGAAREAIIEQLHRNHAFFAGTIQEYISKHYCSSNAALQNLKGIYTGRRCFIIGTGPSLRISDLEKLQKKGEITFASNRIFKLYPQTCWRPDLYCVSDLKLIYHYFDTICELEIPHQFIANIGQSVYGSKIEESRLYTSKKHLFNMLKDYEMRSGEEVPKFSDNPARYVVDGGITVTYAMLQWAYYLGFKEVYFLGVDFDYGDLSGKDTKKKDHCIENYVDKNEDVNSPKLEESLKAYQAAKRFADTHDFKIYNATRGGKLEVFERRTFDKLIED